MGMTVYGQNVFTTAFPYALQVDESDATGATVYKGIAVPGTATSLALWSIQKISVAAGITSITWAGGSNAFTSIWDNRASLTYS